MLEFAHFPVREVTFGSPTRLDGDTLQVDVQELTGLLAADERLGQVEFALARPESRTRIVHVLDVLEPRLKVTGGEDYFPGLAAPLYLAGAGRTNRLAGLTLVVSADVHDAMEAIIDMAGKTVPFSKFASTLNLVLTLAPADGVDQVSFVRAILHAKLQAAIYLAKATRGRSPAAVVTREWRRPPSTSTLPQIAYINYLQSRGFGRERLLYGAPFAVPFPTLIGPTEGIDGAIVYNGHTSPGKNVTYNHQHNATTTELLARQGEELWLAGVILANHNSAFEHKERTALLAARLAKQVLGADGVIISKDGGGQGEVDVMLCCTRCEELGLPTVVITKEEGGTSGSFPLVHISPHADAVVSTGNGPELMTLDLPMEQVIGGERLFDGQDAAGPIELPFSALCGTTDIQGGLRMGTAVY